MVIIIRCVPECLRRIYAFVFFCFFPPSKIPFSWLAFEGQDFTGRMYVLEAGSYSDLRAMGCSEANPSILSMQTTGFVRLWLFDFFSIPYQRAAVPLPFIKDQKMLLNDP